MTASKTIGAVRLIARLNLLQAVGAMSFPIRVEGIAVSVIRSQALCARLL